MQANDSRCTHLFRRVALLLFAFALFAPFDTGAGASVSILPLPAISSSRNEGTTAGNLTVLLFTDEKGIYRILAPMVTDNTITGPQLSLTWLEYLGGGQNFSVVMSQTIGIDHEYTLKFRDLNLMGGKVGLDTTVSLLRDSTFRFFGFTAQSLKQNETNYTDEEIGYLVTLRYQPSRTLWVGFSERFRDVAIGQGKVSDLPFTRTVFPGIPGAFGSTVVGHRLTATYDTRDLDITPSSGTLATIYSEIDNNFETGNDRVFNQTLLEGRRYLASSDGRFGTVVRGELYMTGGRQIPFYEQAMLGGEDTLRDFGKNRFIDENSILVNLEERIRVYSYPLFGVVPEFQVAPFVDIGEVFGGFNELLAKYLQFNPGIGIRGVVRPNVVGRLDIGFGREGTTIFVGSDFPF